LDLQGDNVYFDPVSAAIHLLDSQTLKIRKPTTEDLIKFVHLVDFLKHIKTQSTALICSDVPDEIKDRYRLYFVLKGSPKPVVTGAFTVDGLSVMREMLIIIGGSEEEIRKKPRAIFDVCPSSPLSWSNVTCQNLIDCARYGLPAELVAMPLCGANAPVTLAGALIQHTAENLSGIVIHQLVQPGAPIIYGGSPGIFEMRKGTTPMGAIETMMLDCSYAQIGKHLKIPTHAYLGLSDSKILDVQAGLETSMGFILGALAGVNVISGAGMLDFESCQSLEKLVIDDEICGMAYRLIEGIDTGEDALAINLIQNLAPKGQFFSSRHTLEWFRREQFLPSSLIDRSSRREWEENGAKDSIERAGRWVEEILRTHQPEPMSLDKERELAQILIKDARRLGIELKL